MVKNWVKRVIFGAVSVLLVSNPLMMTADASAMEPYSLDRSGKQVLLDWADIENAVDYSVVKIVNNAELGAVVSGASDYMDDDTLPNHDYKYRVTARILTPPAEEETVDPEEGEQMDPEGEVEEPMETYQELFTTSVVRYGLNKLSASSKLTTYNSVTVSYGSVYGVDEYEIYRSTKKTSGFKKIAATNKTSYTNKSLALNTTYYYKVRGKQTTTNGTYYTNWSTVLARKTALGGTTLKVSKKTHNAVKLSWTKADGATKYKIYRSTNKSKGFKLVKTVSGTTYTNKNLNTGTTYYYKLVPYRGAAKGPTTKTVSAKLTLEKTTISYVTPVGLGSVQIKWAKVAGASGYKVYRATSKTGQYRLVKTTKSTSYTDKKLSNNKTYYYKVKAYRKVGKKQVNSASSSAFKTVTPRKAGQFKVASSGYYVLNTSGIGYYSVCASAKCDWLNSYDENGLFYNKAYVYAAKGEYLTFDGYSKNAWIASGSHYYSPSQKSSFTKAGHYLVGFDIKPGTYKITSSKYFYYSVCSFVYCDWSTSDYNGSASNGGTRYVTLYDGDFLEISANGSIKGVRQ